MVYENTRLMDWVIQQQKSKLLCILFLLSKQTINWMLICWFVNNRNMFKLQQHEIESWLNEIPAIYPRLWQNVNQSQLYKLEFWTIQTDSVILCRLDWPSQYPVQQ